MLPHLPKKKKTGGWWVYKNSRMSSEDTIGVRELARQILSSLEASGLRLYQGDLFRSYLHNTSFTYHYMITTSLRAYILSELGSLSPNRCTRVANVVGKACPPSMFFDTSLFSFSDGVYCITTDLFYPYVDMAQPIYIGDAVSPPPPVPLQPPTSRHLGVASIFLNSAFDAGEYKDPMNIPVWADRIFAADPAITRDVLQVIYQVIGRMIVSPNDCSDTRDRMSLFLYGRGDAAKQKFFQQLLRLYAPRLVVEMVLNHQIQWEKLSLKKLIISYDIGKGWTPGKSRKHPSHTELQHIMSGEDIVIRREHVRPRKYIKLVASMILAGTGLKMPPDMYSHNLSRRLLVVHMPAHPQPFPDEAVQDMDTSRFLRRAVGCYKRSLQQLCPPANISPLHSTFLQTSTAWWTKDTPSYFVQSRKLFDDTNM